MFNGVVKQARVAIISLGTVTASQISLGTVNASQISLGAISTRQIGPGGTLCPLNWLEEGPDH